MPFVTVQTVRGILDEPQKQKLLDRITDVMVEVEGRGDVRFRESVWVRIDEQEPTHWSLGGRKLTRDYIERTFGKIGPDGRR